MSSLVSYTNDDNYNDRSRPMNDANNNASGTFNTRSMRFSSVPNMTQISPRRKRIPSNSSDQTWHFFVFQFFCFVVFLIAAQHVCQKRQYHYKKLAQSRGVMPAI